VRASLRRWLADPWALAALGIFIVIPMGRLGRLTPYGGLDLAKAYIGLLLIARFIVGCLRKGPRPLDPRQGSPLMLALVILLLVNAATLKNTHNLAWSILWVARLAGLFIMWWLITDAIRRRWQVHDIVSVLLAGTTVIGFLCIFEVATGQYIAVLLGQPVTLGGLLGPTGAGTAVLGRPETIRAMRAITVFIDANFMCAYLVAMVPLALAALLSARTGRSRLLLAAILALTLFSIVQTGSRGGLLGLTVALVCLWLLWTKPPVKWLLALTGALAVSLYFLLGLSLAPEYREGFSLDYFLRSYRYGLWRMALRMIADHPFFGVGPGDFVATYAAYRQPPAHLVLLYVHNTYLQLWAESGIFGILSLLAVLAAAIAHLLAARARAPDPQWRRLVEAVLAGFVGYLAFMGTSNGLHDQTFWLLLAMVGLVSFAQPDAPAPRRAGPIPPRPRSALSPA
jgi:O-antigen ligase